MSKISAEYIARTLGCGSEEKSAGGWKTLCPAHNDAPSPSLSLTEENGKVLFKCFGGCSQEAVLAALKARQLWDEPSPKKGFQKIWDQSKSLTAPGSHPVSEYFNARGLSALLESSAFRFHPSLRYTDQKTKAVLGEFPCIIAKVTDKSGNHTAIHRIYLSKDKPGKAPVPEPKLSLGSCKGSAIYVDPASAEISIAEGIETILAIREATDQKCWAALSTSGLINAEFPPEVKTVRIWSDRDSNEAGQKSAVRLAHRIHVNGICVYIHEPPTDGMNGKKVDWLDVYCAHGKEPLKRSLLETKQYNPDSDSTQERVKKKENKSALVPADLAEKYLQDRGYDDGDLRLRYYRDEIYRWNSKHYQVLPDEELIAEIMGWLRSGSLRESAKMRLRNEIAAHVQAIALVPGEHELPYWINDPSADPGDFIVMRNGILNLKRLLEHHPSPLDKHDPRYFNLCCLPFDFNPNAECSTWLKVLKEVQPDPKHQRLLQMWMGYNLIYDTTQERFMLYVGEGANGKTAVITVQRELLGNDNISAVTLEQFNPERTFPLATTVGKLANIVAELNEVKKVYEGELKKFVTGELMPAERKFKPPFQFTPTARVTFATNVLPHFNDRSSGLWRRAIILPFNERIPENRQDKRLIDPKFWRASGELAGIFNWAIAGLVELRTAGRFEEPPACAAIKETYMRDCNPARSFLQDHCEETNGYSTSTQKLYEAYREWAIRSGFHPLSANTFSKEVLRAYPSVEKSQNVERQLDRSRCHVWRGLKYLGDSIM